MWKSHCARVSRARSGGDRRGTHAHVADELDLFELRALAAGARARRERDAAEEAGRGALDDLALLDRGHEALRVLGLEEEGLPDLRVAEHRRRARRVDRGGEGGRECERHRG
jgi:hypothetical protein